MTQVLITGARGWIGGRVAAVLRSKGVKVDTFSHPEPLELLTEKAAQADVVVHAGGVYSSNRELFIEQNIEQGVAISKGVTKTRNTVIFCSSVKVYGWAWSDAYVCDEKDGGHALDGFGVGKRLIEQLLSITAARSISFRISNVYGPGSPTRYAIGKMVHDARTSSSITLTCTGMSLRDFVHIDDVVEVLVASTMASLASKPEKAAHSIFNLASGSLFPLMGAAEVIQRYTPNAELRLENGRVLNSPSFSNQLLLDAGLIDKFVQPSEGLESYMKEVSSDA